MHRKNLVSKLPLGMVVLLCAAPSVFGIPDPDLFDGRIAQERQGGGGAPSSGEGTEPAVAGANTQQSADPSSGPGEASGGSGDSGSEPPSGRDFGEVGGIGGGLAGTAGTGPPSASKPTGSGGEAQPVPGEAASTPTGGGVADSSDAMTEENRDFSQISGFGGTGPTTVEVNSSKATVPSPRTSSESAPDTQGSGTGGSGSQATTRSGSGDFGETLPSGI